MLGLNKMPWWGQLLLYVVLGVGVVGAHHYFLGADLAQQVEQTQARRATIEASIARARIEERRLPEFRARMTELNERLASLKHVLPETKDVGDLLRRIQTLATQSSLTIRGFKPQAVAQRQQHAEWPISLELEGTYHDLGGFFDKVSRLPRIINISGIQIAARDTKESFASTVAVKCTVTTFVLSEPPAAANAPVRPGVAGVRPPTAAR